MAPSVQSSPFYQMRENPAMIMSLLRDKKNTNPPSAKKPTSEIKDHSKRTGTGTVGNLLKMFKLVPMLTSGCKMVGLLGHRGGGRTRPALLKDDAATTTGTIFGYRTGRVSLAVQEDPHCMPVFVMELPLQTAALNREMMTSGDDDVASVRIALESETRTHRKKLMEEFVWAVFCNGKKLGYSIRRMHMTADELHVMHSLRGVSTGAGVLPPSAAAANSDGDLTYMRARFDRVVGSKDSEALHMINPDAAAGPELSIFFLRRCK